MSAYVVNKVTEALKASGKGIKGSNILVTGLVYRPGVKETYNSPSKKVIKELRALGANVFGHDPVLGEEEMVDLLGVESPNGHKIDCAVSLHNRNYNVGLNAENKITPMNMFK
jgi:UDP-N-acetyl-D-mannosaminuronate dehydrogenase